MITIVNGVYLWMPYVLPTGKRLTSGYSVFSASQQREGWIIGIGCGQRRSQNKIWGLGFRVWDFVVPLIFGLFYEFLSFYNTKGFIGGGLNPEPPRYMHGCGFTVYRVLFNLARWRCIKRQMIRVVALQKHCIPTNILSKSWSCA